MMAGMSEMNRRDFGVALAMLGAMGIKGEAQETTGTFGPARVIVPELAKQANGTERWNGPSGTLNSGEAISMHESVVPAGTPKVAQHRILHSEVIVVIEGTLSYQHEAVVDVAHAGSVIYVAYGTNHLVWNSGTTTARYFVLQIGGDTKKA
jgi:quercetin dioxygenase-like cupin family protein